MSRHIITAGPKHDPLSELDIDELVERLTPGTKTWQELVDRLQILKRDWLRLVKRLLQAVYWVKEHS